jgi:CIC family chloride channel protein
VPGFDALQVLASLLLLVGLVVLAVALLRALLARKPGRRLWPLASGGVAAVILAGVAVACHALYGRALALGPGEEAIRAAAVGGLSLAALLALLGLKALATSVTAGGGGVGGLFFPLVVMGTALGAAFDHVLPGARGSLLPLVGMASLLGAAYHTPLAGVSFVAEATGRVGFLIPTFVATAAAYATIGSASISRRQRSRRPGPIEGMLDMPVADILTPEILAVPERTSVEDFVASFALRYRHGSFPVVDDEGRYRGIAELETALEVPSDRRSVTTVGEIASDELPVGDAAWTLRRALEVMGTAGTDVLPVVDGERRLVGSVITAEIFRLDEILDRLRRDGGRDR